MKKSFILHKDTLVVLDEMSDEQAGKLFKAIKAIQCGDEIEFDLLTRVAIAPFKAQFDRDADKYGEFVEKQRDKGKKSAEARANRSQPRLTTVDHGQPQPTYSDSVSVSVSDSVNDKKNISKKKTTFTPPTLDEVKAYVMANGYKQEFGTKIFDYYSAGDWKDAEGKPVKSWKQKIQGVWFKPNNDGYKAPVSESKFKMFA